MTDHDHADDLQGHHIATPSATIHHLREEVAHLRAEIERHDRARRDTSRLALDERRRRIAAERVTRTADAERATADAIATALLVALVIITATLALV